MPWRWPLAALAAAAALTLTVIPAPAVGASGDPPAAAGWHGREIRQPLPEPVREAVARFPRGWSAGSVGRGSGYARPDGSRRVREIQRRLVRRGYRPGPVDGRFGARTRAALLWFQTKHALPRTGRVDARSLATLRQTPPARPPAPTPPRSTPQPTTPPATPAATPQPTAPVWLLVLVGTISLLAVASSLSLMRARGRPRRAALGERHRTPQLTTATAPPARVLRDVIGYVALARHTDRDRALDTAAHSLGAWCERRGWRLTQIVHDVEPASGRISDRPGLAYALEQVAAGRAAGIVLDHLSDLTRSASELAQLLQWLNHTDAFLIALDHELDPPPPTNDLTTHITGWEHGPIKWPREHQLPPLTRIHPNARPQRWDDPT